MRTRSVCNFCDYKHPWSYDECWRQHYPYFLEKSVELEAWILNTKPEPKKYLHLY